MEERTANYPGYRDESTMKVIRHESLGIYIYSKPKNQCERDYNDNMTEKAEGIRCRHFESIVNERYDFFDKETRRVTSLPTSRRRQKRRTPSGRTCTSTSRGSARVSAPSERSPLTSVSSSWSICRQHRRYTALKRNCTPTLLQVIGQPTPNRVQSYSFELPRCEGGRVKLNLPRSTPHRLS